MKKRGIALLGSTGTIGQNTLDVIDAFPEKFTIIALAAGRNIEKLKVQIRKYLPKVVSVEREADLDTLKKEFPDVEFGFGKKGIKNCIQMDAVDVVMVGIVGFAGLEPTLEAVRNNKTVGLANKESLVVAGPLFNELCKNSSAVCIPVDSEHNAIFQLLENQNRQNVETIVLTASGGPFFKSPELNFDDITPAMAIKHPNWIMGPKISVDSATLMNKGLELIEAHFLFNIAPEKLEVWVHPQSIVHGAIWMKDHSCLAQLSKPDMKSSIGFAMSYPDRLLNVIQKLSFKDMAKLEFYEPDEKRFPCLRLAKEALVSGHSHLIVLNAANEIAVDRFLKGTLLFSQIASFIESSLEKHSKTKINSLEDIYAVDREFRTNL